MRGQIHVSLNGAQPVIGDSSTSLCTRNMAWFSDWAAATVIHTRQCRYTWTSPANFASLSFIDVTHQPVYSLHTASNVSNIPFPILIRHSVWVLVPEVIKIHYDFMSSFVTPALKNNFR